MNDWPWSSTANAELFGGLAFLVLATWGLMCLLWWLGTHWNDRKD
jgi:hypothetical protein